MTNWGSIQFMAISTSYPVVSSNMAGTSPLRFFSPPARWGLLDFIRVVLLLLLSPPSPPPRPPPLLPPLPPLPHPLLPCQLLAMLFANFGAQCELLDLNLGPSQLSAHRWTSSSVRTAGPQRPDRMPEDMPDRMSDRLPEDMPGRML